MVHSPASGIQKIRNRGFSKCLRFLLVFSEKIDFSSILELRKSSKNQFVQQNEAKNSTFSIDTKNFFLYAHDGTVYEFSAPKSKIEHFKSAINFQILTQRDPFGKSLRLESLLEHKC